MRHYGHLVAAQDNASGIHVRVGSSLLWDLPGAQLSWLSEVVQGPLRVSPLNDHFFHFFLGFQSHSEWQTGSSEDLSLSQSNKV